MWWITFVLIFVWTQSIALALDFRFAPTPTPNATQTAEPTPGHVLLAPDKIDQPGDSAPGQPSRTEQPNTPSQSKTPQSRDVRPSPDQALPLPTDPDHLKNEMKQILTNMKDTILWLDEENKKNYGIYTFDQEYVDRNLDHQHDDHYVESPIYPGLGFYPDLRTTQESRYRFPGFRLLYTTCLIDTAELQQDQYGSVRYQHTPCEAFISFSRGVFISLNNTKKRLENQTINDYSDVNARHYNYDVMHDSNLFGLLQNPPTPYHLDAYKAYLASGLWRVNGTTDWVKQRYERQIKEWETVFAPEAQNGAKFTQFVYERIQSLVARHWIGNLEWRIFETSGDGPQQRTIIQRPISLSGLFVAHQNIYEARVSEQDVAVFEKTPEGDHYLIGLPAFRHLLELQTGLTYFFSNRQNKKQFLKYHEGRIAPKSDTFYKSLLKLWPKVDLIIEARQAQPTVVFAYPGLNSENSITAGNLSLLDLWTAIKETLAFSDHSKFTPWELHNLHENPSHQNRERENDFAIAHDPARFFSLEGLNALRSEVNDLDQVFQRHLSQFEQDLLKNAFTDKPTPNLFTEIAEIFGGSGLQDITLVPKFDTHTEGVMSSHSTIFLQRTNFGDQVTRIRETYQQGVDDMIQGLIVPAPLFPILDHYLRVRTPVQFGEKGMAQIEKGFALNVPEIGYSKKYLPIDSQFPMEEVLYINQHGQAITGSALTTAVFAFNLLLFWKLHQLCLTPGKFKNFSDDLRARAYDVQRDFRIAQSAPSEIPREVTLPDQTRRRKQVPTPTPNPGESKEENKIAKTLATHLISLIEKITNDQDIQLIENSCYRVPFLPLRSSAFSYIAAPPTPTPTPTPTTPVGPTIKVPVPDSANNYVIPEQGADNYAYGFTKPSTHQMNTTGRLTSNRRELDRKLAIGEITKEEYLQQVEVKARPNREYTSSAPVEPIDRVLFRYWRLITVAIVLTIILTLYLATQKKGK